MMIYCFKLSRAEFVRSVTIVLYMLNGRLTSTDVLYKRITGLWPYWQIILNEVLRCCPYSKLKQFVPLIETKFFFDLIILLVPFIVYFAYLK